MTPRPCQWCPTIEPHFLLSVGLSWDSSLETVSGILPHGDLVSVPLSHRVTRYLFWMEEDDMNQGEGGGEKGREQAAEVSMLILFDPKWKPALGQCHQISHVPASSWIPSTHCWQMRAETHFGTEKQHRRSQCFTPVPTTAPAAKNSDSADKRNWTPGHYSL